jgi:NADH:ubiquinone oxidoreductase subunit 4 (subunit M)
MRHLRFFQDEAVKIPVIPAQAWNPEKAVECWIPAYAGMTGILTASS